MLPFQKIALTILLAVAFAVGVSASGRILAQPGTEADPVVSLSYLEAAMRADPIVLEGGEEFALSGGRGVALIEGRCALSPPEEGRWWILDVTAGEVLRDEVEMEVGHWYLPIARDDVEARFSLQAFQTSIVAVPAIPAIPALE